MNIAMKIARETELCVFIKMCVTACECVRMQEFVICLRVSEWECEQVGEGE